jgi:integrase/recombinase XerC
MIELIKKFLTYLEIERNLSDNTIFSYENDLIQFHNFLKEYFSGDGYSIEKIDRKIIRYYLGNLLENDYKKKSISRKIASIRSFFRFLSKKHLISKNPAMNLILPKVEKKLPVSYSVDSLNRMMSLPDSDSTEGLRDRAILELFYSSGIRESELINLNLTDVDLVNRSVRVFGKGRKERIVPLGAKAREALKIYLDKRSSLFTGKTTGENKQALFLTPGGTRYYRSGIYNIVRRFLSEATEGEKCSPHVLRHSFATHLLDNGADINSVKEMLGHSSLSTTQIYTHISVEHLKKVYALAHPKADLNKNEMVSKI